MVNAVERASPSAERR